jgi:hypothetical protein
MDMGVAQSDWQFHAYNGTSKFEGDPFPGLRAVFSVHPEPFTVIARADSGIETFDDLKGKRVNIGNPGLRPARDHGGRAGRQGLDDGRLRARLRASAAEQARRWATTRSTRSSTPSATRTARSRRRRPPSMPS